MAIKRKHNDGMDHKMLYSVLDEDARFDFVESYKMLRTNLEFVAAADKCKMVEIVSSVPDEGKSNVIVNLAYTIAKSGKKVCVVDCDLRKPCMYRYFKVSHKCKGLTNVLAGQVDLDSALIEDNGVSVLLSGDCPPNPSEILSSNNMKNIIQQLNDKFDFVLFDTPPITIVTDAIVLGKLIDGAIIVVRYNYSDMKIVRDAKKYLEAGNIKIFGTVISNYTKKYSSYKKNYYYSYYTSQTNDSDGES